MKKVLLIFAIVLSSCTQKAPKELTVTYVTAPLNVPSILEKANYSLSNTFAEQGISIKYAEITSGADQTQALASGDVQILNAVGATSIILAAANGVDIKVLSMYSKGPKSFAMYSKDSSIRTPQQLKGKTIAGPVGSNLHELLVAYLKTANMTIDDVNFVNTGLPEAKAGLDGGSIDVALLAGPIGYAAEQAGYAMITNGGGLIDAIIAVASTKTFYKDNPTLINEFLSTQNKIVEQMYENPAGTLTTVANILDLPEQAISDMYKLYDFSPIITEDNKQGFQRTADFMFDVGMIESSFDVSVLFN